MSAESRSLTPERFAIDMENARLAGFDVLIGDDFTLLLDLDGGATARLDERVLERARDLFGVESIETWTSKSGPPNQHARVKLSEPLDVATRIALQAILGSDPIRELLALARLRNGVVEPSSLFKPRPE